METVELVHWLLSVVLGYVYSVSLHIVSTCLINCPYRPSGNRPIRTSPLNERVLQLSSDSSPYWPQPLAAALQGFTLRKFSKVPHHQSGWGTFNLVSLRCPLMRLTRGVCQNWCSRIMYAQLEDARNASTCFQWGICFFWYMNREVGFMSIDWVDLKTLDGPKYEYSYRSRGLRSLVCLQQK